MRNHLLSVIVVTSCLFGCAAFDNGVRQTTPASPINPDVSGGGGAGGAGENSYQGFYTGKKTVESESCTSLDQKVGDKKDFSMDVLQSGNVINFQFEDGSDVSGTLAGARATALLKQKSSSSIYDLTFSKDGVTGTISIVESTTDVQAAKACATYKVELKKGEKPAGWGESGTTGKDS